MPPDTQLRERVRQMFEASIGDRVAAARKDPQRLHALMAEGLALGCLRHACGAPSVDVAEALRWAAEAGAESLDRAQRGDGLGQADVDLTDWLVSFLVAALLRDRKVLDRVCGVPLDLLRQPQQTAPDYAYDMAAMLRDLHLTGNVTAERALDVLKTTDPQSLDDIDIDTALALDVPVLELLWRLSRSDEAGFNESLERALEKHVVFWDELSPTWRAEGWMAWRLAGLCAIAVDRGLAVHADSPWLPMDLIVRRS